MAAMKKQMAAYAVGEAVEKVAEKKAAKKKKD